MSPQQRFIVSILSNYFPARRMRYILSQDVCPFAHLSVAICYSAKTAKLVENDVFLSPDSQPHDFCFLKIDAAVKLRRDRHKCNH